MAGNTLMSLLVKLGVDTGDFDKGLDTAEKKSKSTADSIGHGLAGIGAGVAGGIVAAGVAGAAFLASTIGPASDLNETISKTTVVFGESSKAVLAFGENAAMALGMSKNEALTGAATFGNLFRAMQIGEKTSADMSMSLVSLAGDLASFNNMDPTEVLNALRSGLSGETEPLKRLGININQALIEQKALSMGLWDGIVPLTAAAKAQAVYALAMEQTTLAQGDFARTSDGVANQQRILAATFEDLKAKIGTALLPMLMALSKAFLELVNTPEFNAMIKAVTDGLTMASDFVIANIPTIIQGFENLKTWFVENQGVIVAVLVVLGIALLAFGIQAAIAAATAVVGLLPIIATVLLIGLAVYLLYLAWTQNWLGIQEKTAEAATALQGIFEGLTVVFEVWKRNTVLLFEAMWALIHGDWKTGGEKLGMMLNNTFDLLDEITSGRLKGLGDIWKFGLDDILFLILNVTNWQGAGAKVVDLIKQGFMFGLDDLFKVIFAVLSSVAGAINEFLTGVMTGGHAVSDVQGIIDNAHKAAADAAALSTPVNGTISGGGFSESLGGHSMADVAPAAFTNMPPGQNAQNEEIIGLLRQLVDKPSPSASDISVSMRDALEASGIGR
jgi:hypothetical protein